MQVGVIGSHDTGIFQKKANTPMYTTNQKGKNHTFNEKKYK